MKWNRKNENIKKLRTNKCDQKMKVTYG